MGSLYLVRHGQASFGADDYDQLSALGSVQCRLLGEYLARHGLRFDRVLTGRLKRHRQSLDALRGGFGQSLPEAEALAGLDEYDSEAVVRAIHPGELPRARSPDQARQHFKLLREGLLAWMEGRVQPQGMPSHAEFRAGVADALTRAREQHQGRVLVVSSGGPIATAVGLVLDAPPASVVDLNMRLRNSALCEMVASASRHSLLSFNTLPHLDTPALAEHITYA
ncbi:MAG: histidine phosphatase family protein [Burkholderiales bacterium]|nr:histidine phosphatase family protein [Burkholderiales bacterium]